MVDQSQHATNARRDGWLSPEELATLGYRRQGHRDADIETAVMTFGLDRVQQIEALILGNDKLCPIEESHQIQNDINCLVMRSLITECNPDGKRFVSPAAVRMMENEGYIGKTQSRLRDATAKTTPIENPPPSRGR